MNTAEIYVKIREGERELQIKYTLKNKDAEEIIKKIFNYLEKNTLVVKINETKHEKNKIRKSS